MGRGRVADVQRATLAQARGAPCAGQRLAGPAPRPYGAPRAMSDASPGASLAALAASASETSSSRRRAPPRGAADLVLGIREDLLGARSPEPRPVPQARQTTGGGSSGGSRPTTAASFVLKETRQTVVVGGELRPISLDLSQGDVDRLNDLVRDVKYAALGATAHELGHRAKMATVRREARACHGLIGRVSGWRTRGARLDPKPPVG